MDISGIKVIDAMVMENPPRVLAKPHSRRAAEVDGLFHDFAERSTRGSTTEEMIAEMREMGIEKGILEVATTHHEDYDQDSGIQAVRKYPEVFVPYASDFSVNPKDGMLAVRRLELLVKKYGAKLLHIMSSRIGAPPSDKMFYPLFAKCIELDIPVTLNVGIPGPNYPARFQDPIHIDEICWFFPELKVVMTHGGEPWQFMCVKLMLKWPNLYYMT
ncbi:MAG: amidohydrolase family protein, partial [Chloroflexi bacterium]|nr:amidohydrolase family protein [Chloroflexota bacterium]